MALSNEDKKDVAGAFGKKTANKIAKVTNDSKNKAIHAKTKDPNRGFGLPYGEKYTPQLGKRFKNYFKKHAGIHDKADKGYGMKQNNFYEFNKKEYD